MKKFLSILLVVVLCISVLPISSIVATAQISSTCTIESISAVPLKQYIKNYSGSYDKYDYNEESEDYNPAYFRYDINSYDFKYTVTFNDGQVFIGEPYELYQKFGYYPSIKTDQCYENQWGLGKHTAIVEFMGVSSNAEIEIIATPVESIEVIYKKDKIVFNQDLSCMDRTLAESYDGAVWKNNYYYNNSPDYAFGYGADAFMADRDYIFYYYLPSFVEIKITFKDDYKDSSFANELKYTVFTDQEIDAPWQVGMHSFTVNAYGYEKEFQIEIVECENPLVSISVDEPVILYQYSSGDFDDRRYYENDDMASWYLYKYHLSYANIKVTLTYEDGSVITGTPTEIAQQTGHSLEFATDQGSDDINPETFNLWDLGNHTATIYYGGMTADFEVKVISLPVVDFEIVKTNDDSIDKSKIWLTFSDGTQECTTLNYHQIYSTKLQSIITVSTNLQYPICDGTVVRIGNVTKEKCLDEIKITSKPKKVDYTEGEVLNLEGLTVEASYDDKTSEEISYYEINGYTSMPGTKTITVSYCGKIDTFQVTVKSKIPTSTTSTKHTVSGTQISKITAGVTVSSLLSGLSAGQYCKVYKGTSEVSGTSKVGTGMVVKIMDGNTVKTSYTVIVTGDTNGDGDITITDMLAIKAHVLKKSTLSGAYATAADTSGDGGVTITDFIQVKAKILGKGNIVAR